MSTPTSVVLNGRSSLIIADRTQEEILTSILLLLKELLILRRSE